MRYTVLASIVAVVLAAFGLNVASHEPVRESSIAIAGGVETLVDASVLVKSGDGSQGSGVAYKNGFHVFVWTDAHVVSGDLKVETVVDQVGGQPTVRATFSPVTLVQAVYVDGKESGRESRLARVVRYSESQDLALLKVEGYDWPRSSVEFACSNYRPRLGEPVWHVGSMKGEPGINSLSDGLTSAVGRVRYGSLVYDQFSVPCHRGCSGGGIYRKSDNKCIALVAEAIHAGDGNGSVLCHPVRRIREYATTTNCLWALDGGPVPEELGLVVTDPIPLPDNWKSPRPATTPFPPIPIPLPPNP